VTVSPAAERYAHAAFELALADGALDALAKDVDLLAAALKQSADLRLAAASPVIASEEKARAFHAVARKLGLSESGCNLVGLSARNGRAGDLAGIAAALRRRIAEHKGLKRVEIVSARPLAPADLESILVGLSKELGGDVEAVTTVDESLLGGFIVRAGARQFDASLRTKLNSLKLALKVA
jgi:F-type H+-transporting ATPase subunit delta